ncbi:hypothetical protein HDU98_009072 [Podochytrium sp. JEL0797]|nr:hypothetical protein HDU98_009072 [Podochytrium sp. JEL0797]
MSSVSQPLVAMKPQRGTVAPAEVGMTVKTKLKLVTREIAAIPLSEFRVPKASLLDPLLGRMTISTLQTIFETEISHCLRAMESYSTLDPALSSCPSRRRLLLQQFSKCWDQYGPHLPKDVLNTRFVEVGEALLRIQGFHDVADSFCFSRYLKEVKARFQEDRTQLGQGSRALEEVVALMMGVEGQSQGTQPQPMKRTLSQAEASLVRRCQYGLLISEFLSLFIIDLTLESEPVRARVFKVLKSISSLAGECASFKTQEWLALEGAKHVMMIVDALWDAEFTWNDTLPFLSQVLTHVQKCQTVLVLNNITWLMDLFGFAFSKFIHMGAVAEAKTIFQQCSSIVDVIFSKQTETLDSARDRLRNTAYKSLNDMAFLLVIVDMANGKLKPSISTNSSISGSAEEGNKGAAANFRKVSSPNDPIPVYSRVSKARKSIKFEHDESLDSSLESVLPAISQPKRASLAIPARRTSVTTQTTRMKADIEANIIKSASSFKPVDTASKLRRLSTTGRNSVAAVKFKMQQAVEEDFVAKQSHITPEPGIDLESLVETSTVAVPASVADSTLKPKKAPKKLTKVAAAVIETEEQKTRRLILTELIAVLRCFEGDKEKVRVLAAGLEVLWNIRADGSDSIISTIDFKSVVFNMLLDLTFEIVTMPNDTLVQKGGFLSTLIGEPDGSTHANPSMYNIGRLPSMREISHLIQDQSFSRFHYRDMMKFCRQLFQTAQLERFVATAQVLEHHLSDAILANQQEREEMAKSDAELTLLAAIINFQNIWHSERKVLFEISNDISATAQDLRWKKLEVPEALRDASVALLFAMAECLEFQSLMQQSPKLYLDCVKLLSAFVEHFVEEYGLLDRTELIEEIKREDVLLRIMRSIHLVVAEFPNKEIERGIKSSLQLASLLEKIEELREAALVLDQTSARIIEARANLGDGHANQQIKTNISCLEIEVYQSLFRCDMKQRFLAEVMAQTKHKEEYERLTKKVMKTKPVVIRPTDSLLHFMCGGE